MHARSLAVPLCLLGFASADAFANDRCQDAIELTHLSVVSGSTSGASGVDVSSCGFNDDVDVWYAFPAPSNGIATFTISGGTLDPVLTVFDDCGGTELACNGFGDRLAVEVNDGVRYLVRVSGSFGGQGTFTLGTVFTPESVASGPDVILSEIEEVLQWGMVDGVRAYSISSDTCNIGDADMIWGSTGNGSPALGMNAYRLHDGRLMQIGLSWAKRSSLAGSAFGCGPPCNGNSGSVLGVGCRDGYSAGFNGSFTILGPRSNVNAFTGVIGANNSGSGDAVFKRLQIAASDLDGAAFPDALYFVEGVYVGVDDAPAGNWGNNASYRRVLVDGAGTMTTVGPTYGGRGALYAWRDHGSGANTPDTMVQIDEVDVPGEGRFLLGSKVTPLVDDRYRYDYALFNLNSDRGARGFLAPSGADPTGVGFHAPSYHSGEPYDNASWDGQVNGNVISWETTTFSRDPNASALRWGTMYNYWFESSSPPIDGMVRIELFKPGGVGSIDVAVRVPGEEETCLCEFGGDTNVVNIEDLLAFLDLWLDGDVGADIDGGGVSITDLLTFLGCWFPATGPDGCA